MFERQHKAPRHFDSSEIFGDEFSFSLHQARLTTAFGREWSYCCISRWSAPSSSQLGIAVKGGV